jgi:hypothetical protein
VGAIAIGSKRMTRNDVMKVAEELADGALAADRSGEIAKLSREAQVARVFEKHPALYQTYLKAEPNRIEPPAPISAHRAGTAKPAAWDAIEREAESIRSTQPQLGREAAIDLALRRRPDLYTAYNAA